MAVRIKRVEFRENVRAFFPPGTKQTVRNNGVSVLSGCPQRGVRLYTFCTLFYFLPQELLPSQINIIPTPPTKKMATRECPLKRTVAPEFDHILLFTLVLYRYWSWKVFLSLD